MSGNMAKKKSYRGGDAEGRSRKRQKIVHEPPTSEEVTTSRQLQQLLAFDQDLKRARHGAIARPACSAPLHVIANSPPAV